jgi:hypothetical protein
MRRWSAWGLGAITALSLSAGSHLGCGQRRVPGRA